MKKAFILLVIFLVILAVLMVIKPCTPSIRDQGTVVYRNLEGGFWGIVSVEGKKYLPMNFDPAFHKDGLHIKFKARKEKNVFTTTMWGTPIHIISVKKVVYSK